MPLKTTLLSLILLSAISLANDQQTELAEQYQDAIDEQEANFGAYHPALAELHNSYAQTLQTKGDHKNAIRAFKQAMHIKRVDEGINSLSQETMMRGLIGSYDSQGNASAVASGYTQLLDLYQTNYGALSHKLVPLLLESGDWHRAQYLLQRNKESFPHLLEAGRLISMARSIAGNAAVGSKLALKPSESTQATNTTNITNTTVPQLLRSDIKNHYYLIKHYNKHPPIPPRSYLDRNSFPFRQPSLNESSLEYRRAYDTYLFNRTSWLTPRYQREQFSLLAQKGLTDYRELSTALANSRHSKQQAEALAQQGDWLQLFYQSTLKAHNLYRQSWQILTDAKQLETRHELFDKPLTLPAFDKKDPAQYTRIAKVKADISTTGQATNIIIVETQPDNKQVAKRAKRQLGKTLFRSRLVDGQPIASQGIELNLLVD